VIFAEYIKSLRATSLLTLRDVESGTGISNSYLSQLENGKRGIPTLPLILKLASVYGVTRDDMIAVAINDIISSEE
jgi:transcriptional regulator with XRE-family HTH domain